MLSEKDGVPRRNHRLLADCVQGGGGPENRENLKRKGRGQFGTRTQFGSRANSREGARS